MLLPASLSTCIVTGKTSTGRPTRQEPFSCLLQHSKKKKGVRTTEVYCPRGARPCIPEGSDTILPSGLSTALHLGQAGSWFLFLERDTSIHHYSPLRYLQGTHRASGPRVSAKQSSQRHTLKAKQTRLLEPSWRRVRLPLSEQTAEVVGRALGKQPSNSGSRTVTSGRHGRW